MKTRKTSWILFICFFVVFSSCEAIPNTTKIFSSGNNQMIIPGSILISYGRLKAICPEINISNNLQLPLENRRTPDGKTFVNTTLKIRIQKVNSSIDDKATRYFTVIFSIFLRNELFSHHIGKWITIKRISVDAQFLEIPLHYQFSGYDQTLILRLTVIGSVYGLLIKVPRVFDSKKIIITPEYDRTPPITSCQFIGTPL